MGWKSFLQMGKTVFPASTNQSIPVLLIDAADVEWKNKLLYIYIYMDK
jgi:hypothetical protein